MIRFVVRIALVIFGVLFPLIILELTVRVLGLAPPAIPNPAIWDFHPELGWWHIPNSGGTFYSSFNEFEVDVQINSLGLRDDVHLDEAYLKSDTFENQYRILILADSFAEALQVPLEETFYKQLQNNLIEAGQATQTINAGVGSWGTDQEALFYRLAGGRFKPDLTLLFFFTRNDVVNNYGPLEIARNGGSIQKNFFRFDEAGGLVYPEPFDPDRAYDQAEKPPPLPPAAWVTTADWLWLNSALYRWATPYLRDIPPVVRTLGPSGILGGEGRIRATHPAIPVPFFTYQTPLSPDWEIAWDLTEAILSDLRNQVEADGGQFAVVIIPAREQVYTDEWTRTVAASAEMSNLTWDIELPNSQLHTRLARQDILYLDLLSTFREAATQNPSTRLYFRHDGHWTEAGHHLASETIFDFIEKHEFTNQKELGN
ncbi:MAG: hypothetical protein AAF629_25100 [Chloroflexota bacterium]